MLTQRGSVSLFIFLGVVIIIFIVAGVVYYQKTSGNLQSQIQKSEVAVQQFQKVVPATEQLSEVAGYIERAIYSQINFENKPDEYLLRIDDTGAESIRLLADGENIKLLEKLADNHKLQILKGSFDKKKGFNISSISDVDDNHKAFQWQEIKVPLDPYPYLTIGIKWYFNTHKIKFKEEVSRKFGKDTSWYLRLDINGAEYQFQDYQEGISINQFATEVVKEGDQINSKAGVTYQVIDYDNKTVTLRARQWALPPLFIPSAVEPQVFY